MAKEIVDDNFRESCNGPIKNGTFIYFVRIQFENYQNKNSSKGNKKVQMFANVLCFWSFKTAFEWIHTFEWIQVILHVIPSCLLKCEVRKRRGVPGSEIMTDILKNLHMRATMCVILAPQKHKDGWSQGGTSAWRNIPSRYAETANWCWRKRINICTKLCSKSGPTSKDLFGDWPWNFDAPFKTQRIVLGLLGLRTAWRGKYHSRVERSRGAADRAV